jgi:hypothetical protein
VESSQSEIDKLIRLHENDCMCGHPMLQHAMDVDMYFGDEVKGTISPCQVLQCFCGNYKQITPLELSEIIERELQ